MNRKFSVILGGDGIGKSATISCAQMLQRNLDFIHWSTWSFIITQNPYYPQGEVDLGKGIENWRPEDRTAVLTKLIQAIYVQGVLASTKPFILVDSFYYRFLAKEILFKKCSAKFFCDMEILPIPSSAIIFDSNPQLAWQRKQGMIKRYEYLSSPTFEDFCCFQNRVHAQYTAKLIQQNVPILWLNPEDTIEINAKKIVKQVEGGTS